MNRATKAALFGGAIFAAGIASQANAQCYRLGGPTGAALANSYQYAWDWGGYGGLGYLVDFRAALESPYNFGGKIFIGAPSSIAVQTVDVQYFNASTLNYVDGLIIPWVLEPNLTYGTDLAYIGYFNYRGGDLFILADASYADPVNSYLGIPSQYSYGYPSNPSNGAFPAFDGPFGPASNVVQSGSYGTFNVADITSSGGRVIGTNAAGEPTVAFWDEGDFCPSCGAIVLTSDVDMITTFGVADYGALNQNARFALNCVAALFDSGPPSGADCDGNGVLNVDDVDCFVNSFLSGEL